MQTYEIEENDTRKRADWSRWSEKKSPEMKCTSREGRGVDDEERRTSNAKALRGCGANEGKEIRNDKRRERMEEEQHCSAESEQHGIQKTRIRHRDEAE